MTAARSRIRHFCCTIKNDMSFRFALPQELRGAVDLAAADWTANNKVARFWQKDPSLWTSDGEEKWLGWIDIVERQQKDLATYAALGAEVEAADFQTILLLGMGGSSLCPEVLSLTFGQRPGFPALRIVDSTDPEQVWTARNEVNLANTLVVVASKSGSTLEPNVLKQFFFNEMKNAVGADQAGSHFVAITDPGSKMEQVAKEDGFRYIFYGDPTIGGRFSALSPFGVVAATLAGLNTEKLLDEAAKAVAAAKLDPAENFAVQLGLLLGTAANAGRDKLTIFTSPEIADLGAWMEQLVAESTGKLGKGITPVDREAIAAPAIYGNDRLFVYIRYTGTADSSSGRQGQGPRSRRPARRNHRDRRPLRDLRPVLHLGGGHQRRRLGDGHQPLQPAGCGVGQDRDPRPHRRLRADRQTAGARSGDGGHRRAIELLALRHRRLRRQAQGKPAPLKRSSATCAPTSARFTRATTLPRWPTCRCSPSTRRRSSGSATRCATTKRVATCLGFGPRFLHSTGQDYKGGPNSGVFLQITADHSVDVVIPGQKLSFGVVIDAQAAGDLAVLESRGRRALRIHLGKDLPAGLEMLATAVEEALS